MQPARFGSHLAACILSRARSVGSVVAQRVQALGVHGSAGESSTSGPTDLATKGPYVARLKSRGVIRFDGPDVVHYLQGLLTNDVTKFESKTQQESAAPSPNTSAAFYPPVYSAVLSPQGRVLFDLFLYKPSAPIEKLNRSGSGPGDGNGNTPALLADVDAAALDDLLAFLKKHRLRAKVDVQDISQDLATWQHFGGNLAENPEEPSKVESGPIGWGGRTEEAAQSSAEANSGGWRWFKDPRLGTLGMRGLFPSNTLPPLVEAGEEVDDEYYLLWRLEQGIPEGSIEIPKGEAIPLEYNLAGLSAISFEKGCYVGQELVARTHHRGVIRKRLMPVNFLQDNGEEAQQAVTPGAEVVDRSTGKKVGKVTTVLGPRGLALMRLEPALKQSAQLHIENNDGVSVKVMRPKWWPGEWGHEDEQQAASSV
ncbi:unnamed protein product [Sphagnum jensenii]|uniref:CAF17 C-terminal domain-containing protein n=1 Tax=Sphagnum jensenii TaxID=128206 RepID=A0ABP0X534_9BRYO